MLQQLRQFAKEASNLHRPGRDGNVFVVSTPRSGSTWLMELINTQPGFKCCDEPDDIRNPLVQRRLGIETWEEMYSDRAGTTLEAYFRGFVEGRLRFMNPNPLRRHYRPLTHRIVFKLLHVPTDRLNWLCDRFNGRVVYLLRHPIPVTLSREVFPRVNAMLTSDYRRNFTQEQVELAWRLLVSGSRLQQGVLSWCLENVVPLRQATPDWTIVTYEQMVLDPVPAIEQLATKLGLPEPERMLAGVASPSASTRKSERSTRQLLREGQGSPERRSQLIVKWRRDVGVAEEQAAMDVLKAFGLDAYVAGGPLPSESFWIGRTSSYYEHKSKLAAHGVSR